MSRNLLEQIFEWNCVGEEPGQCSGLAENPLTPSKVFTVYGLGEKTGSGGQVLVWIERNDQEVV